MKQIVYGSALVALMLAGCGGGACCQTGNGTADGSNPLAPQSQNEAPKAVITGLPSTAVTGDTVSLNGENSSDDKGITQTQWSVNDTPVNGGDYTFDHAGTYNICLTVSDEEGLSDQTCQIVTVTDPAARSKPPVAIISLSGENSLTVGSHHTFNCLESYDQDTIGNSDPKAAIQTCTWTIRSYKQDGSEGRVCANGDSFKTSESFEICGYAYKIVATLTVTDDEGETNTTSKTYTVIH